MWPRLDLSWQAWSLIVGLLTLGAVSAKTISDLKAIPAKIDAHAKATDSAVVELRGIRTLQEKQLCLEISQRRGDDWTRCVEP